MSPLEIDLDEKVEWVFRETLKIHRDAPETRLASSLSLIETLVALYYGEILHFEAAFPLSEMRDRCIISKGHGSICLYPILADLGFFPRRELGSVCKPGSFLGGIPDPVIPGYETVNGSLGHGLGVAAGMAVAMKQKGHLRQVFVIVGDGELHEGANWEAMMFASQHKLDNLHLIVDDNGICMLGHTDTIVSHHPLAQRLEAFGWQCVEVDGHDVHALQQVLSDLQQERNGRPKALIAKTLKGHRIPDFEDQPLCHVMSVPLEVLDTFLEEKADEC